MDFAKVFNEALPLLLEGLKLTVITSLVSIGIGMIIGLFVCLMKMSKNVVLRAIAGVYIWIIRRSSGCSSLTSSSPLSRRALSPCR